MATMIDTERMTLPAVTAAQRHKAIIRRFVDELWNAADLDLADQLFAADCVPHALQSDAINLSSRYGPKHIKLIITAWRAAFPDWHITITDLLAEDDKVVLVSTGRGTHRGALMGIAPTGKRVALTGVRTFRLAGDKIAEYWVLWDWHGLWVQLGASPKVRSFGR